MRPQNTIQVTLLLAIIATVSISAKTPVYASTETEKSPGQELKEIFDADQSDRNPSNKEKRGKDIDWSKVQKNDRKRLARTSQLLKSNKLTTANDYYHAAMIFQHGDKASHYKLSHILATIAAMKGHKDAPWLCAASFDRLMGSLQSPQVFGTQYYSQDNKPFTFKEPKNLLLLPDSVRKEFKTPTRQEAINRLKKLNSRNSR